MWTVGLNGAWHTAGSDAELIQWVRQGRVPPNAPVRHASWAQAVPAGEVPALVGAFPGRASAPIPAGAPVAASPHRRWLVPAIVVTVVAFFTFVRFMAQRQIAREAAEAAAAASAAAVAAPSPVADPAPGIGAVVRLEAGEGYTSISVSRSDRQWNDADIIARLPSGTVVTIVARRELPGPAGALPLVRYQVEFARAGKKLRGWVHASAVPGGGSGIAVTPDMATAAPAAAALPPGSYRLKDGLVAATRRESLDRALTLLDDPAAFSAFVRTEPGVFTTVAGDEVTVIDSDGMFGPVHVRRRGKLVDFWTVHEALDVR